MTILFNNFFKIEKDFQNSKKIPNKNNLLQIMLSYKSSVDQMIFLPKEFPLSRILRI